MSIHVTLLRIPENKNHWMMGEVADVAGEAGVVKVVEGTVAFVHF